MNNEHSLYVVVATPEPVSQLKHKQALANFLGHSV